MKCTFVVLLLWMVCTVYGDRLPSVALDFPFGEPNIDSPAIRLGEECLLSLKETKRLGWKVEIQGDLASVKLYGKSVKAYVRKLDKQSYLPLRAVISSVGGATEWNSERTKLHIFSFVRRIRVERSSVSVECTLPAKARAFSLKNPHRVVVDFQNTRIDPKKPPEVIGSIRYGQFNPHTLRVVAEVDAPPSSIQVFSQRESTSVQWKESKVVNSTPNPERSRNVNDPAKSNEKIQSDEKRVDEKRSDEKVEKVLLKIPIIESNSDDEFQIRLPYEGEMLVQPRVIREKPNVYRIEIRNGEWSEEIPKVSLRSGILSRAEFKNSNGLQVMTFELARPMTYTLSSRPGEVALRFVPPKNSAGSLSEKLVVVDPGHGGQDTGARYVSREETLNEKEFNLEIAKLLTERLIQEGCAIILTRDDDYFVELYTRPAIANSNSAHFFISIHINSNTVANSRSGATTYYHRADPDSKLFAECIQSQIVASTGLPDLGAVSDTKVYPNGFAVLRHLETPGVLVEVAYINNDSDRELLKQREFRAKVAEGIVNGLRLYLGETKNKK